MTVFLVSAIIATLLVALSLFFIATLMQILETARAVSNDTLPDENVYPTGPRLPRCTCHDLTELERYYGEHYDNCPSSNAIYRTLNRDRLLGINEAPADGPLLTAIRNAQELETFTEAE